MKHRKSILKPVIKAQERIERFSKKRAYKSVSDPGTSPDAVGGVGGSQAAIIPSLPNNAEAPAVHPSPTKVRMRKSRHRRQNSRGSNSLSTSSPQKSPSKDVLQNDLDLKSAQLVHRHEDHAPIPTTFKYLGPGTAVRDLKKCPGHAHGHGGQAGELDDRNLNDVCFGCDGGCSDATCSSKRSSRVSDNAADVESNVCETPCTSPTQGLDTSMEGEVKDDHKNMNVKNDMNENSESLTSHEQNMAATSFSSSKQMKRSISDQAEKPTKIGKLRSDSTDSETRRSRSIGVQAPYVSSSDVTSNNLMGYFHIVIQG